MPHRPEIHRWYCTKSWERRRRHQMRTHPLCELCLATGKVELATIADHVENHNGDYDLFRLGALRSLCKECHDRLDNTYNKANHCGCDVTGRPLDPDHHWNKPLPSETEVQETMQRLERDMQH